MAVSEAAASGDRMDTLKALRSALSESIDSCESGRDMAALSKRLMEVMQEIDALERQKPKKSGKLAAMQSRGARKSDRA